VECLGSDGRLYDDWECDSPSPPRWDDCGNSTAVEVGGNYYEEDANSINQSRVRIEADTVIRNPEAPEWRFKLEGQGSCEQGLIYASDPWTLAPKRDGHKEFDTAEYMSWVNDAWKRCKGEDGMVQFVSVWKNAGFRCYSDSTCSPNGHSDVKSWKEGVGVRVTLKHLG